MDLHNITMSQHKEVRQIMLKQMHLLTPSNIYLKICIHISLLECTYKLQGCILDIQIAKIKRMTQTSKG